MPVDDVNYGQLENADWIVILVYLIASVGLGISFARRGNKDMDAYFGGSGAIPWWIAGTSLLVACFAADTPLWIGDIIYKRGLEGAWFYWAPAIGTAFFVLIVAPLWKRCGILTDIELLEVRYTGRAASAMRLLNSMFYSMFASIMFLGLQTLSIVKILGATTDLGQSDMCRGDDGHRHQLFVDRGTVGRRHVGVFAVLRDLCRIGHFGDLCRGTVRGRPGSAGEQRACLERAMATRL